MAVGSLLVLATNSGDGWPEPMVLTTRSCPLQGLVWSYSLLLLPPLTWHSAAAPGWTSHLPIGHVQSTPDALSAIFQETDLVTFLQYLKPFGVSAVLQNKAQNP